MRVRNSLRRFGKIQQYQKLGLFGGHQRRGEAAINVSVCDQFADRRPAFAALEAAAMMRLHSFRIVRTGLDGRADALAVQGIADANDHENHLQSLRMIVNTVFLPAQFAGRQTDSDTPQRYVVSDRLFVIRFSRPYRAAAFVNNLQPEFGELRLDWFRRVDGGFDVVMMYANEAQKQMGLRLIDRLGFG